MNQWPYLLEQMKSLIYTAPAILIAICVHEASHGLVSYWLGDPTPKEQGRLSLNPFRHMDIFGTICMVLFHFGWAKPVRVNPGFYKKPKLGMCLVALAGPVSNFIVAFLFCGLYALLVRIGWAGYDVNVVQSYGVALTLYVAILNLGLGLFNLIPIPPLDGSKVLAVFFPDRAHAWLMKYERYGSILLLVALYFGIFDTLLVNARTAILGFMMSAFGL